MRHNCGDDHDEQDFKMIMIGEYGCGQSKEDLTDPLPGRCHLHKLPLLNSVKYLQIVGVFRKNYCNLIGIVKFAVYLRLIALIVYELLGMELDVWKFIFCNLRLS